MPTYVAPALDREQIFAALYARLQAQVSGVTSFSRILLGWDQVQAEQQPRLTLTKGDENPVSPRRGMPPQWKLQGAVHIYVRVREGDPDAAPSIILNQLITDVERSLARQPVEPPVPGATFPDNPDMMYGTTLGGLCSAVLIDGPILTDEGTLGLQAVAIIPIALYAVSPPKGSYV